MSTTTHWYNTERFRQIIASGYPDFSTIEILSIEEVQPWQLESEDDLRIADAWEVKSRHTSKITGFVYEETNIVIIPESTMQLAKNVRRIV